MRITNHKFTTVQSTILRAKAALRLQEQGYTVEQSGQWLAKATNNNILMMALGGAPEGFPPKQRGGKRPNTGNRTAKGSRAATTGDGIPG